MKKVLFAASEALPFSSSGGLGDVIGSLPAAIKNYAKDEYDVRVVVPYYSCVYNKYKDDMKYICNYQVSLAWRKIYAGVFSYEKDGVTYYFIDNQFYFFRGTLYGHYDDAERFAFFSKAILDLCPNVDFFPDIIHANDWQTALVPVYLKTNYAADQRYSRIKTIFTIHNINFQGVYGHEILSDVFDISPFAKGAVDYNNDINLMKGAMVCCDILSTVSPRYAQEIKWTEFAHGLAPMTNQLAYKTIGILNGIDTDYYNPQSDRSLVENYSWRSATRKKFCKKALQNSLALDADPNIPIIAVISRLTSQKGLDLISSIAHELLCENIQFILLGSGDESYENFFRDLEYRNHNKVRSIIKYDKDLSKQIYAGADIFLMPSKTEPCGLSQMIASRYGTVPVVRETGGLYDSINSYYELENGSFYGNGFTFSAYNAHDMLYVIKQALALYEKKDKWGELVKRVMKTDFSWNASAAKYVDVYNNLINI